MDSTHSSSDHDDGGWEGASESTEATASCSSTSLRPAASRGKRMRSCKWSADWKRYRMTPSKKGAPYVYCTLCQTDISIASGGVYDVRRHVDGKKHKEYARSVASQVPIKAALQSSSASASVDRQVTVAEVYFATFIAEHNLPFSASDHFSKLCKVMFPDSEIAKKFSSGRTKTTALVKHALAPAFNDNVIETCQSSPFSILCDGGNDQVDRKFFAILVRYWDQSQRQAVTRFLALPVCNIATAEALFESLSNEIESRGIPWSNMIGYASDSASVMVGVRNSVLSRVRSKQPKIFSLGCLCHLAALCAAAALKKLPVSIDELLIDIFYHFKHSSKRYSEFSAIREEFSDIAPLRILKHCTTRWLSLERCVKRLLDQWPALYAYFDKEAETDRNARLQRIAKHLKKNEVKLLCHFVSYALKGFSKFSLAFQTHASRIGTLQSDVLNLLKSFLSNFIDPSILRQSNDITAINYQDLNAQLKDSELAIGTSTRMLLCGELEDEVAGTVIEARFYRTVRTFYETAVCKIIDKFPFNENIFKKLLMLDPRNRFMADTADVLDLANRFMSFSQDDMDSLTMEYLDYRSCTDDELLSFIPQSDAAIDHFWADIRDMKTVKDLETLRFEKLSLLAKALLVLPHSKADPERLFSMVRKIYTELRRQMDPSTLSSLLSVKVNNDNPCYLNQELMSDAFVTSAKSATQRSLLK